MFLIALGANLPSALGAPRVTLTVALARLAARGLACTARSPWYRTPAHPPGSGPDFINGAACLDGSMTVDAALEALHEVERGLGRDRTRRWGPRVCDLDLLACAERVLPDEATVARWMRLAPAAQARVAPERLILPHPRLHERAFVLVPLADVAPDWRHPLLGLSVAELASALPAAARAQVTRL